MTIDNGELDGNSNIKCHFHRVCVHNIKIIMCMGVVVDGKCVHIEYIKIQKKNRRLRQNRFLDWLMFSRIRIAIVDVSLVTLSRAAFRLRVYVFAILCFSYYKLYVYDQYVCVCVFQCAICLWHFFFLPYKIRANKKNEKLD